MKNDNNSGFPDVFPRAGITLMEIVVALAISVLMVGATAGVLKSMAQKKAVFADQARIQPWQDELMDRFRKDFLHADQIRLEPNGISFSGPCGYDSQTKEFAQVPALVTWQITPNDGRKVLLRIERKNDPFSEFSPSGTVEVMGIDMESVDAGAFTGLERPEERGKTTTSRTGTAAGHWMLVPSSLQVCVKGKNDVVLVDEVLFR